MLVEDDDSIAVPLAKGLVRAGFEVERAATGGEALAQGEVDVVLLDIGLPKLNGYGACRKIREQPSGKGIVLIALTGWGQDEDRGKSQAAGFDAHMVKPVDYDALMKLLAELRPSLA